MSQPPESPDVSAIITGHNEGMLAGLGLRSLLDAVAVARDAGLSVEILAVLDNPDRATHEALAEVPDRGGRLIEVSHGDHGLARNDAIGNASGRYLAFLDADDLWSENWVVNAFRMCESEPGRVIAHPAVNWIFDNGGYCYFLPDQTDEAWNLSFVRVANPWDQLCMAPAEVHRAHPYHRRDLAAGFAYLDWSWNLETIGAGYVHRVVPDTIHFKRRRSTSQFTQARDNRSLPFESELHDYAWWAERDRRLAAGAEPGSGS